MGKADRVMWKGLMGVVAGMALTASQVIAAPVLIDHFTAGTTNLAVVKPLPGVPPISVSNTDTDVSILGGNREVTNTYVGYQSLPIPPGGVKAIVTTDAPGVIDLVADSRVKGDWVLEYGATYAGGANLGDLTAGGTNNAISVGILFADQEMPFVMTILDTNANSASYTLTTAAQMMAGQLDFYFTSFSGVDLTSVDSMRLFINGTSYAKDATVDFIRAQFVPEPGTFCTVALALMIGLHVRRRYSI